VAGRVVGLEVTIGLGKVVFINLVDVYSLHTEIGLGFSE
jgi:hypothetical protein